MKGLFINIYNKIKDSIHHAINDEAEDWSIMPSDIANEIDNGFLAYAEGLEEQCETLQAEQTAFMQTQTEVLNSHVMNEHLHLTSFQTEAIDKVPQKLDRTDFEAHLQDDARHLTFSDKDTLSQVSQKLDREEFEKHAGNYSAHLSHWQSQQIEDSFKFRNIVASVSEATEAGTYLVQSTAEDLPEGLEEIAGYHELRVYSYDSDRKPEKKPFRSEEITEIETPEPEITEPETEPKNYHILVQSLDVLKNDSYQNYIRLAYLEKTQKPMVEEDLAETETRTYTFSTWKKQVAVGAEGFEDLVESVLGLENKYNAHEKNTQIHTSQSEKDTWNAKAVIKGLESGARETLPENFNVLNLEFKEARYVVRSTDIALSNLPENGYFFLDVKVRKEFETYAVLYAYRDSVSHNMYVRRIGSGQESSWKLIAQDQEGVAKIKGLESVNGVEEKPNSWNGFNEIITSEYIIQGGNTNAPDINWGVLKTRTNGSHAGLQEYRTIQGKIYQREFAAGKWGTWYPFSISRKYAIGYIDSVTFKGTTPVNVNVLFDDGLTRNFQFFKNAPDDYYYRVSHTKRFSFYSSNSINQNIYGTTQVILIHNGLSISSSVNIIYANSASATIGNIFITVEI